jgi:hypothetical protein
MILAAAGLAIVSFSADGKSRPIMTKQFAATREFLLKTKASVNFKNARLEDVIAEMNEKHLKGIRISLDATGGVSGKQTITYKADGVTLEEALFEMFDANGLHFVVQNDGSILVKQGKGFRQLIFR